MSVAGSFDTNVLLRLLLNDIPKQHMAAKELLNNSDGRFAVSDVALVEVIFVLERHYQFTRRQIVEVISDFAAIPKINCNRSLLKKSLPLFVESPALSFEDCCLAAYAEIDNAEPLWTFDRKLANQASSVQLLS